MGTPRIVGLKTMHIALRRLQLENGARVVLTQKGCQLSTQTQKPPASSEGPRSEDKSSASVGGGKSSGAAGSGKSSGSSGSSGSGGSGGGAKILLSVGVAAGAGAAAYYYWNENARDPFTWVNDQLPITKKKPETKPAVTETGGLKVKNNTNQVMAATEKTGEKPSVLRSVQDTKLKNLQDSQAKAAQEPKTKSDKETQEKTQKAIPEKTAVPVATAIESPKIEEIQSPESPKPDSPVATTESSNQVTTQTPPVINEEEIKEMYEKEIRKALTRQALVYQDIAEQSKNDLKNEYERKLKIGNEISVAEHMVELRAKYGQATAALAAMEKALRGRREQEIISERSRKLWTYCNVLYHQINYDPEGNSVSLDSISTRKASLLKEFSGDSFVVQLLKTLPDDVESTESLRVRFFNVIDKSCRKVALFKNGERITFWKYILGSLQESLVTKCEGTLESGSTPFEILDRTSFHLKRGELLEAVCTLNKIQGLPREICRDWLLDARVVLEANQTLFALMTHAMANNNFM